MSSHPEENLISRTYKILATIQEMNLAKIRPVTENNRPIERPDIIIRCDTIPAHARTVGTTFRLGGNPLELKLFENSAGINFRDDVFGPNASN